MQGCEFETSFNVDWIISDMVVFGCWYLTYFIHVGHQHMLWESFPAMVCN